MSARRRSSSAAAVLAALILSTSWPLSEASADTLVYHAVSRGQQALDEGEGGGNPFATALIELLKRPRVSLAELASSLSRLTATMSGGRMDADVPSIAQVRDWSVVPPPTGERRIALVLVVSDYGRSGGAQSLPGARHDAGRITAALAGAGFDTETALDLDLAGMRSRLADFAERSRQADAAVIYTTGHGVEVGERIFLLPADYPVSGGRGALTERAVPLAEIAAALAARGVNMVFFGGCRDDPF